MSGLDKVLSFELTIRLFQDGNQFFENKFSQNSIVVGREAGVDLIIEDRSISRKHLQINQEGGKVFVTDLGSSNGTFVDNIKITAKTEIASQTHIRIGKIIIQLIPPELKSANLEKPKVKSPVAQDVEQGLTLSRIALQVEAAVVKAEAHEHAEVHSPEQISAMVDKNFIQELTRQHESSTTYPSKKIESLVLWNEQIYNIQDFSYRETIVVGPTYDDSIHIPSLPFRWSLSKYDFHEAVFQVPKNLNVFAIRGQNFLSKEQLLKENRLKENQNSLQIQISFYDVLRVEIDPNTQLYFRYVPSLVDLDTKKIFNPNVLVKQAILASFILHFLLAFILLIIPKEKILPKPAKAPERIAKLLVEEKPVVLPPPEPVPEPPPPEVKKEEPPPPPPKKKVEPPKPKPKLKPKPEPKPEPKPKPQKRPEPLPQKVLPPRPVQKAAPVVQKPTPVPVQKSAGNPVADNKPSGPAVKTVQVAPKPTPPPPPPPKPVDISKLGALAAIGGLKLDAKSNKSVPTNVNIAANTNTTTNSDIGTTAMTSELKSQTAGMAASNSANASGPIKTKGAGSVGGSGYGTAGLGTGTGKRGVKGGVVGKPSLSTIAGNGRPEGLSRDQVLKAMQSYLGKIQSCYERSLLSDPNLSGRIEFEWNIAKSGRVTNVDIKKNSVAGGEQLGDCVSGVIKSIKFPSALNGEETNPSVGFPFGRL